jgi:chromatin segregation and condensation protein Rec8/ScpA/Scc1 (kleisin family)
VEECTTRIEVIVRFLALLELCKMGRVTLGQGHTFGDLRISWLEGDAMIGAGAGNGAESGRGLAELSGYEIDDYEG